MITFEVRDTPCKLRPGENRDEYYNQAHACIIMFDVTSRSTHDSAPNWYIDFVRVCKDVPIIICGDKVDVKVCSQTPGAGQLNLTQTIPEGKEGPAGDDYSPPRQKHTVLRRLGQDELQF